MKKNIAIVIFLVIRISTYASDTTFNVTGRYINIPVCNTVPQTIMRFTVDGKEERHFYLSLAINEPDYWVYADATPLKGKTLTISYEGKDDSGIKKIFQDDKFVGQDSLYKEKYRPQVHFTAKRGKNGDANGMVYYDGEYHMFFQHSPYGVGPRDQHWGHAVSSDLVHWEELPDALWPDKLGEIYSGSAVIDHNNTAGFGKEAMVAIYTNDILLPVDPRIEVQSLAYSNDRGRTWTKYKNNPVMDVRKESNTMHTRDPKVFWYEPSKHWVMVLFVYPGFNIYTSSNLKEWTYQSSIEGFNECPELFPLPVDGDKNNIKWVMYDVFTKYYIGDFDGKKFTPTSPLQRYSGGALFAFQTFNNIPESDGRRIQTGWAQTESPKSPFTGMKPLFTELTLRTTPEGVMLFNNPVKEYDELHLDGKKTSGSADKVNEVLKQLKDCNVVRVKARVKFNSPLNSSFSFNGQPIIKFDLKIDNLMPYYPKKMEPIETTFDIIVDITSIEVFIDEGRYTCLIPRDFNPTVKDGFKFTGDNIEVKSLEIYPLKSIW